MYDTIECPDWFAQWVVSYGRAFGISAELTDTMLRIWWPAFHMARFVEADFTRALPALVGAENPPNWPREHLGAVNRALRAAKDQRTRRAPEPSGSGRPEARCAWCGGDGWVSVPHPKYLANGEWVAPHPTVTPACTRCDRGERSYQAHCETAAAERRPGPMTIDQYEKLVGTAWAEIVARHEQAQRLMARAVSATDGIDRTPNLTRLANAFAMPK
ncbi:unnamed protein product [Gemmata massiliana]|uniref:Uncharacterized protein n=1 Tax=Gemmata massiliana TaxID=1210884 RepID=A0A6P2CV65_9BACT|nr:hypothetical protein [Gemmata massiliana]VTR92793.1 unnamed protein product [Gemmata massiliana]